jgi:hypothetical protein
MEPVPESSCLASLYCSPVIEFHFSWCYIGVSTDLVVAAGARRKSDALGSEVSFRCPGRVIRGVRFNPGLGTVEYDGFGVFGMDFG